jgi:5-carboxymethyl-2-hydroxymuconate isomerase
MYDMPQLELEYSTNLPIAGEVHDLARDLHAAIAQATDASLADFKTRLSPIDDLVIADGDPRHGMVHLDMRLLSGRSDEVKQAAGTAALAVMRDHLEKYVGNFRVQFTVEVHDLDRAHYHKHVTDT